jgi:hypothetical protein
MPGVALKPEDATDDLVRIPVDAAQEITATEFARRGPQVDRTIDLHGLQSDLDSALGFTSFCGSM